MTRRDFLKSLKAGAIAAAVAPKLLESAPEASVETLSDAYAKRANERIANFNQGDAMDRIKASEILREVL